MRARRGCLDQSGFQVDVAFGYAHVPPLARRLMIARANPGPQGHARGRAEDLHVHTQLGDDDGRQNPVHPGNLSQQLHLLLVRLQLFLDASIQFCQVFVQVAQAAQLQLEHIAMVLFHAPVQSRLQLGDLAPQTPLANSAISAGVAVPSASASSISMPETPNTSLATLASLILAVSSTFSSRLHSALWLSANLRR